MEFFKLTKNHVKLLRAIYVETCDAYDYGPVPIIGPKRPYGNSDHIKDILTILGLIKTCDDDYNDGQLKVAKAIQAEMPTALQIILCTGDFKTGTYYTDEEYDSRSWKMKKPANKRRI